MARNKDFFVNSTPKRDRSFFVKEEKTTSNVVKANTYPIKDKYNSAFAMPVKQGIGDKVANFFKMTLPTAAEKAVDNIKEPFTGASASKLMTEAKLSPQMMVEDAKIQMAKENPTREDYAMVKQTQEVINKYGKPESNFRAISEDTTKLQEQLKSAEKTWQVSPVDATLANTGAGVANIFGSLGSFANSLGADKVPLLKDVTNFAVDGARKAQENAQQYNRGNYGEALGTVTQGVVNLVPYFVLGTGKTAVKGATAVTKYAKYIEPIIKNPSFWYSLTSMWGSKYQEKLDEGYNRFQALGNSILYAVPAALIEVSGGIGAKGKEAQSLLRTMGEEIGEEIAQDIMGGISDKVATNHDLPIFSTTEDAIINPKQLAKTAAYTAPIVAIGGGANRVINNIANPNSQTEALPEMDVSTQNQLANITKNIEYQKQNENLANNQIEQIIKEARNNMEKSKTTLALPEGGKFYADENGVTVDSKNYVAPRQETIQTEEINKKNELINKINNNTYLPEEEKANLINHVNNSEYTEDFANGMEWLLKNVDEEFGLKNISNNFKDNKAKYGEYLRDETEYDKTQIDNAKNSVAANKSGRRTKEQWLQVAKNLGSQIYEMSDAEIEKLAYKTWMDNKPNNKDNLNRQGQKYVKFGLDEWVNTVYDEVKKYRAANPTQKVNNKLPTQAQNVKYSPVNAKQVLVNPKNTEVGKNVAPESPTNDFQEQGKQTILPTQKAQKTYQSAKIAGMTDVDMKKAIDLNNMLRSGVNLEFYDEKNIPQNVQADKAKIANGFYRDGTLWINKNSKNKVEQILGHELTHHLETTNSYTDLSNTILDSDVFYDYISEKGYTNVAEYKTKLKEMGYTDAQMNNEMVARFVEEKLFTDQKSIDRLARQNTKLVEKIKNWISDLVVSFKGTAQEKELLRIENMYRKALEQARNTTASAETQYSIGGTKGWNNLAKTGKYAEDSVGWFRDKNGDLKFEFSDKLLKLKDGIKLYSNKSYKLGDILEHEVLFDAYPQLRKYNVEFEKMKNSNGKNINLTKTILLNPETLNTNEAIEKTLLHEIQHAIQKIEGFEGGRNSRRSKLAYYESLGEIEAADTVERFEREKVDRNYREKVMPRSAEANPQHPKLQSYLQNRKEADIIKDEKYLQDKERKQKIKDAIDEFFGWEEVNEGDARTDLQLLAQKDKQNSRLLDRGGLNNEESDNSNIYKTTSEDDKLSSRTDGRGRLAGKEPAFSMPETDNQGRTLSKEQQEFFKDSKLKDEKGNLISYYHGTQKGGFNTFEQGKQKGAGKALGDGFYFTQSKSQAQTYASAEESINKSRELLGLPKKEVNPQVYEVYLNAKNPLYLSEYKGELVDKADYIAEKYLNMDTKNDMYRPYKDYAESKLETAISMIDYIKSVSERSGKTTAEIFKDLGYDALVDGKYQTVVFEPNQIKNVDNTNPTENPDIRYSVNPVNIAKNPPNIETGLDQLNRTKRVKEGDSQSNFAGNILNQSIFDEKFTNLALDDKNIRSYESISNKETLQEANDAINEQGQKWVDRFLDKPNGEMKATDIAGGFILMNRYQQVGDYESMIRVAEKLRKAGTQQGQTIQMFSVLGRMTPEGMTYYAQKELSKAYDEILKNKTQKWADEHADEFKLNEKDIEYIQRRVNQAARLPEGRDKYVLLGEIASRIQNKIPPQAGQGLKALARNSMLLNPKTMVRNILGNVVIVPNHIVSDFVGARIDKAISKKTGVRTTGGFDVKALQGAKKGIYESFDDFRRKISTREMGGDRFEIGQGKNFYENHTGRFGETRNKINKALNGLDRVTGFLLETGDRPFYETWFINSLNNQMKLNNVTEPTAEMIEIATDEALQRTWQDNNSYTRVVKSVRDGFNKINIKGYGLGDMVMPFVKTPANLTKAVVDFSPLGAINAAVKTSQFNKDIGKGTATAKQQREVVKAWSQVITGSLGMAILTALANAGILSGGSDEDKDVRSFEQNILGIKPYSIKIGDKTYTYDWAQPLGTSAAMVADTVKSLKNAKDTEGKVAAILEGAQSGASVLLEQSFVSGIRNLFEEDNLINALIETGFNEASKFTPQFLSQLAQIQDDTARTSYVYNNIPQTAINKVRAKIPGLRQTLEPSVDVLGREVKTDNSVGNVMFNPTNTAFARTTEAAEEMYRVYQATGDKATIAQVAPYYFNVGTEKIVLTPKQRTQYQKTIGKIASDGVESLLKNKAYEQLEDTDKAEILKDLYSYGTAIAKAEASTSYLLPNDMKKIKDSGMKPEEYILLKYISNLGGTKKDEQYNSLVYAGYTQKETEEFLTDYKGYKFDNTSKNTLPTLKQQRAKLPPLKK